MIRLGVIGAGSMAMWSIYPALYLAPFVLVATCDLDPDRARVAARKFGASGWYTDHRAMWEAEELDAVIIQMHPTPRQPIVLEALAHGLHVLVPKPPATSLATAQALAQAATDADRLLMVNFQRRFSPAVTEAKRLAADPSFGRLTQFFGSFCSGVYTAERRGTEYTDPAHAFLLDFAVHYLDLARFFGGEVQEMALYHQRRGEGLSLSVALQFASGCPGLLQLNSQRIWWRNYDRLELTGEGQYLVLDNLWTLKQYSQDGNRFTENYSDERSVELTGDGIVLQAFAQAILDGSRPPSTIQDAVKSMELYEAIWLAVQEGRTGVVFNNSDPCQSVESVS